MKYWKKIKNYEDYEVSNDGEVKSTGITTKYADGRVITKPSKILKPYKTKNGYLNVYIYKNKKPKCFGIHRLVAQVFIDNPNNLEQVNHINGDKQDNRVENLEWCTSSYNQYHAIKHGLKRSKQINQYDLKGNLIKTWFNIGEITRYYNVSHASFINCCNNRVKTAYGYIWKYKEENNE